MLNTSRLLSLIALLSCTAQSVLFANTSTWYGQFGIGITELHPDDSGTPFILEETQSSGGLLQLGYHWNDAFSTELFFADLGNAGFNNDGELSYNVTGLSTTYRHTLYQKSSFYLKAGVAKLKNGGDIPFRSENDIQPFAGLGLETQIKDNLTLSIGIDSYQTDAQFAHIALRRRFARSDDTVLLQDTRGWYGGIGAGVSSLKPDASGTPYILQDSQSTGGIVQLGYEWNNRISAELFFSDLGDARFQANQKITYKVLGMTSTYRQPVFDRTSALLKLGVVKLSNGGNLPFRTEKDNKVFFGLGIERRISKNTFLSLEYNAYHEDAQLFTVSVRKNFGRLTPKNKINQQINDFNMLDGKRKNAHLRYSSQQITNPDLLTKILGEMENVRFDFSSNNLTQQSFAELDRIAAIITVYFPQLRFTIVAHTHDIGDDAYNSSLSLKRANTVRDYLAKKGVSPKHLHVIGEGEQYPFASNSTPEGRRLNHRLELFLQY